MAARARTRYNVRTGREAFVELLQQPNQPPSAPALQPGVVEVDERAARRTLREQIAKLERELCAAFVAAYPRSGFQWGVRSPGGPRLLGLGELERVRDDLAERLHQARQDIAQRAEQEECNRILIERMLLDPARHKWVRVRHADIGEPGCKQWHVRPRLGLIGMLMGWWQVKISSGCPLAGGRGAPRP